MRTYAWTDHVSKLQTREARKSAFGAEARKTALHGNTEGTRRRGSARDQLGLSCDSRVVVRLRPARPAPRCRRARHGSTEAPRNASTISPSYPATAHLVVGAWTSSVWLDQPLQALHGSAEATRNASTISSGYPATAWLLCAWTSSSCSSSPFDRGCASHPSSCPARYRLQPFPRRRPHRTSSSWSRARRPCRFSCFRVSSALPCQPLFVLPRRFRASRVRYRFPRLLMWLRCGQPDSVSGQRAAFQRPRVRSSIHTQRGFGPSGPSFLSWARPNDGDRYYKGAPSENVCAFRLEPAFSRTRL